MPQARLTGKSTQQALEAIAWVLKNPNKLFNIKDHHNTPQANRELCNIIKNYIDRLGLKRIEINPYTYQLRYDQPNQTYIELYEAGKVIQFHDVCTDQWFDCDPIQQHFPPTMRFRVKPQLKRWVYRRLDGTYGITEQKFITKGDAQLSQPLTEIIGEFK